MLDHLVTRCEDELRKRLAEMERQGSIMTVESLKKDLEDRKRRQAKLLDVIETAGEVSILAERLRGWKAMSSASRKPSPAIGQSI